MSETPQWRSVVDVVVPHPTQPRLLVCRDEGRWQLPRAPLDQVWEGPIGRINDEIHRLFGLETTVLQMMDEHKDETDHLIYSTMLLDNHSVEWTPPGNTRWLGVDELDEIDFSYPQQRSAVEGQLHELESGVIPALRVPSARPGWRQEAEAWMRAQLNDYGYGLTGPIEQVKNWFLSCILRAPTTHGLVYFKATQGSPLMVREARMTVALAALFPRLIPEPLSIEPQHDWMVLPDFGAEIGWQAPGETRGDVLCAFGRLQIASAAKVDDLIALGCIDRRLPRLADQIDPLLDDAAMLATIDQTQQQQLQAARPRLKHLCAQLADYRVPATLVHGDLHMSNVARQGESYLFFDWSDASIAHPFLDMIDIIHERDIELQTRLRDGYLALWTAYEPAERLMEMWKLAHPLCALHQAVSYQHILNNIETRCKPEMDWAMPFWFGKLLTSLDQ